MTECNRCYNKAYDCDGSCDANPFGQEFVEGYIDGRNPDSLEPSGNRHPAYVHSFHVGRAELAGKPIAAAVSRAAAKAIETGHHETVANQCDNALFSRKSGIPETPPPTGICPQETGQ